MGMDVVSIFILGMAAGVALGRLLSELAWRKKMDMKCQCCKWDRERESRRHR